MTLCTLGCTCAQEDTPWNEFLISKPKAALYLPSLQFQPDCLKLEFGLTIPQLACSCIFCVPAKDLLRGGGRKKPKPPEASESPEASVRKSSRRRSETKRVAENRETERMHDDFDREEEDEHRAIQNSDKTISRAEKRRAQDKARNQTPKRKASKKENDRKRADERRAASIFSAAELEDLGLDDAPFPDAIPMDFVQGLVKKAQDLLHGDHRICAVCDELNLHSGDFADYDVSELPSKMFDVLAPPDGSLVTCPALDPILREQYNVGDFFSSDKDKLGSLLLSQRAFRRQCHLHALPVVDASDPDYVQPRVPMCGRCWRSLKTKPKKLEPPLISIANGLFHGELPEDLCGASRIDLKAVTPGYLGHIKQA
jgi:hypothetical protein